MSFCIFRLSMINTQCQAAIRNLRGCVISVFFGSTMTFYIVLSSGDPNSKHIPHEESLREITVCHLWDIPGWTKPCQAGFLPHILMQSSPREVNAAFGLVINLKIYRSSIECLWSFTHYMYSTSTSYCFYDYDGNQIIHRTQNLSTKSNVIREKNNMFILQQGPVISVLWLAWLDCCFHQIHLNQLNFHFIQTSSSYHVPKS